MKSAAFEYLRPATLAEAVSMLDGETRPFLGGQSLSPTMNLRLARPQRLVDLKALGLRDFAANSKSFHLGAGYTHAAIEDRLVEDMTAGLLPHIAGGIAYRGVRNRGCFGGSLAHADPAADWLTTLLLLGGTVRTNTRTIAAADFCTGAYSPVLAPAESLLGCDQPRLSVQAQWGWCKINRKTGAFADALGGAVLDGALSRVVVGAVEAAPVLLTETSAALRDHGVDAAIEAARAECDRLLPQLDIPGRRLRAVAVTRALEALRAPRPEGHS